MVDRPALGPARRRWLLKGMRDSGDKGVLATNSRAGYCPDQCHRQHRRNAAQAGSSLHRFYQVFAGRRAVPAFPRVSGIAVGLCGIDVGPKITAQLSRMSR